MDRLKQLLDRTKSSQSRGRNAESIALQFLKQQGMRLIARNYRCRNGEIDLIMEQSDTLIFVEVRFRKTSTFGSAVESIDQRKKARIIHCARHYLATKNISQATRFDVVALSPNDRQLDINWIPDAFQT